MNIALFTRLTERMPCEIEDAKAELRAQENKLRDREIVAEAVARLRESWSDQGERHYRPHWFFVKNFVLDRGDPDRTRIKCYQKFWPAEIVTDRAAALRARPDQIGTFADCTSADCATCKKSVPVVGRIVHGGERARDPDQDLDLYALCCGCAALTPIATDFKRDALY